MADMEFKMDGMEELQKSLEAAVKKYPDKAMDKLESTSKDFKKRVVQITKQTTDKHSGYLIKGFRLDRMRINGFNMEKDFRGTAPHFHLIENGHSIVLPKTYKKKARKNGGQSVGWSPGLLIVKQARDEYAEKMPEYMQELIDEITEECGL